MDKFKALFADASSWFSRLTGRERRLVGIAGAAVTGFVVFLVLFSFSNSANGYRRRTQEKINKLTEVQDLAASYREAEAQRQTVERQLTASNVRLITLIEEKGTAAGLDIPTMTPKTDIPLGDDGKIVESSVELTLDSIPLGKLIDFLATIEAGPGVVKVTSLRVEPRVPTETLTAWVTISTYHLKP